MPSPRLPFRATIYAQWLIVLLTPLLSDLASAQSEIEKDSKLQNTELHVGFNGHSRLGAWFPIFVKTTNSEAIDQYSIDTIDADGFPVTIHGQPIRHQNDWLECLMQVGRKQHPSEVRLSSQNNVQIAKTFRLNDASAKRVIHPSTQALTVVIEPDQSIASILKTQTLFDRSSESAIVSVSDANLLPSNWLAWQAVDRLFISASAVTKLEEISSAQWLAIQTWAQRGGNLIVSVGPGQAETISPDGPLEPFCPGSFAAAAEIESSSRVEFFADANEQLIARGGRPIEVCQLESVQGRVELVQDSLPLIVSTAYGFGKLTFVAFDLNQPRFTQWKGYSGLLQRLQNQTDAEAPAAARSMNNSQGNRVSHVGYTDMAGQLRLALDRFSSVAFVSFATIASLIALFILCVGPGDYFLLSKLFGKMELTWLTFPLISLLFCCGAFFLARSFRPAKITLNQLEIIDIDQSSGQNRSSIWTHYYSPIGGKCSLDLPSSNQLSESIDQRIISWQGLPGDGLGGMNTRAVNSLTGQGYQQLVETSNSLSKLHVQINEQPLRVSSTRAMFGQWWSESELDPASDLLLNRRTRHIEGTFSNPLDQPLKDCRLLFGQYVYQLPERLEPGEEIDILGDDLREQTTRSYMNRRTKDDDDSNRARKIPWNPTSTRIDRLAEVLMFYTAAGGQEYTGLSHEYQPFIDLTDHLQLSRAILLGKVDSLVTPLQIDGQSVEDSYDSASTYVRLIFPVKTK